MKRVISGNGDEESHRYFVRFGKGNYKRRFLISAVKTGKIKIKGSFEMANDFVKFANENFKLNFSGKILSKEKISGKEGRKKAGVYVYEVEKCNLEDYERAYFYLLDAESPEIKLRIKKALPKPGKDAEKIDDGFCLMEIPLNLWEKARNKFFWDAEDGKKIEIEHEIKINEIVIPKDEKDPAKIRELAKRKGTIARKILTDGKEIVREYPVEA